MLKLNASYSKKVPTTEKFSSQSYLASIEVELPHGMTTAELQEKIRDTFDLVRQSVENEITAKSQGVAPAAQSRPADRPEAPVKATNKQIQFILKLGQARSQGLPELNALATEQFRVQSIYDLSRGDASKLVDRLRIAA